MITINKTDNPYVISINGQNAAANYDPWSEGDTVIISPRSNADLPRVEADFSDVQIDGTIYTNANDAVNALIAFVGNFKSPGSGGSGPGVEIDPVFTAWKSASIDSSTGQFKPELIPGGGGVGNIGSLTEHTDIKSLDNPTFTIPDPNNEGETITKQIASLEDIPAPDQKLVVRVTDMLTIPSVAKFIAEQHLPDDGNVQDSYIVLRGDDTTGNETNDLTITCSLGYGSAIDKTFPGETDTPTGQNDADGNPTYNRTYWTAHMTKEQDEIPSTIFIPKEAEAVDIFWFVGSAPPSSYWADINGTRHKFNPQNTPLTNFNGVSTLTINGEIVDRENVYELFFGVDYNGETSIGDAAFRFNNLTYLHLPNNITTIGINFALYNIRSGIGESTLILPTTLQSIGSQFMSCPGFTSAYINMDVKNIDAYSLSVGTAPFTNRTSGKIYGESQAIIDSWKTRFSFVIQNWSEVIGSIE